MIGVIFAVSEDGDEFYAEKADFPLHACNDFVCAEVLPKLGTDPARVLSSIQLRDELSAWFAELHRRTGGWIMVSYDYFGYFALLREALECTIPSWMTYDNIDRKVPRELRSAYWRAHPHALPHHALHDARALCAGYRQSVQEGIYGTPG